MDEFIAEYCKLTSKIEEAALLAVVSVDDNTREINSGIKTENELLRLQMFTPENHKLLFDEVGACLSEKPVNLWKFSAYHKIMNEFRNNMNGDIGLIEINTKLAALAQEYLKNISDMKYVFEGEPLTPAKYQSILVTCDDANRRLEAAISKETVIEDNIRILESLFALRKEKATCLGYDSPSQLISRDLHLRDARGWLYELVENIRPIVSEDLKHKSEILGVPIDTLVQYQNRRYYNDKYIKKVNGADLSSPLFDKMTAIKTMIELYKDIFRGNLNGNNIIDETFTITYGTANLWVTLPYIEVSFVDSVKQKTNDAVTDRDVIVHKIYLDLDQRPKKYPHPSEWPLYDDAVLVASLGDKISHTELVSLFHEMGHCFNYIMNCIKYRNIGGTRVERDIVEVPSLFFERYIWDPQIIMRFGTQENTLNNEPLITEPLAIAISNAQYTLVAEQLLINACLAILDIELNDGITTVTNAPTRLSELSGFDFSIGNMFTRWPHQAGYECSYYAYCYAMCWAPQLNHNSIREYLEYSGGCELTRIFGELDLSHIKRCLTSSRSFNIAKVI